MISVFLKRFKRLLLSENKYHMKKCSVSRREFARIMTVSAAASFVSPFRALASPLAENLTFVTQYPDIPRIDAHVHIGRNTNANIKNYSTIRDNVLRESMADIAIWIDLDGGTTGFTGGIKTGGMERLAQHGNALRMVPSITSWRAAKRATYSLAYTAPNILPRHEAGYIGYKIHYGDCTLAEYEEYPIDDPQNLPIFEEMERVGMVVASLHAFEPLSVNVENILKLFPNLVMVKAHAGPWKNNMEMQRRLLASYPNYYIDISGSGAAMKQFAMMDYNIVRDTFLQYPDRILYGTDITTVKPEDVPGRSDLCKKYFISLETSDNVIWGGETLKGLNLPREVLEMVYYKNALKVYPQLKANMTELGYGTLVNNATVIRNNKPQISISNDVIVISGLPEGIGGDIYSISGRKVGSLSKSGYDGTIRWSTLDTDLPAGMYIVNLQYPDKKTYYSSKIILSGRK
jgi:hypothetical protein